MKKQIKTTISTKRIAKAEITKVAKVAVKRTTKVATKPEAEVTPEAEKIPHEGMPKAVRAVIKANMESPKNSVAIKEIFTQALKTKPYRFTAMHDKVRQAVRNAALASLGETGQLNQTARLYGIASANLKKWRDEETQGIHNIRPRGRPAGKLNEFRTIIHKGQEIKARIEDTVPVTVNRNNKPVTTYVLKAKPVTNAKKPTAVRRGRPKKVA